jgi:hypothetical protein
MDKVGLALSNTMQFTLHRFLALVHFTLPDFELSFPDVCILLLYTNLPLSAVFNLERSYVAIACLVKETWLLFGSLLPPFSKILSCPSGLLAL